MQSDLVSYTYYVHVVWKKNISHLQTQFKSPIDINYKILQHYNIKIQHNNH